MSDRPRIFDDMAGMAGGALSVLSGIRDEAEALMRARVEAVLRKLDVVRRNQTLTLDVTPAQRPKPKIQK